MQKPKFLLIVFIFLNIFEISLAEFSLENKVCLTETCVMEAVSLLTTLDRSVSPCDDFYQFSCGKWIKNKKLPEYKSYTNRLGKLRDDQEDKIKELFLKTDTETESPEFIKNIRKYYESCLNTTRLEELGNKPLKDILDQVGGWPLVLQKDWKVVQWTDIFLKLRKLRLISSVLFDLSVQPDPRNSSNRIIIIDQPTFGFGSRDAVLKPSNDPSFKAYKNMIIRSALKLGAEAKTFNYTVNEIINFETLIANSSMTKELRRNETAFYNKVTIEQLIKLAPNISWLKIIRNDVSENITEDEEIVLFDTQYIKTLNEILPSYKNRFLANYIIWRAIQSQMSNMDEEWYQLKEQFDSATYRTRIRTPREETCMKDTRSSLSIALSHLYIKNFFNNQTKEESSKLFKNIINEFRKSFDTNPWMEEEETRVEAIEKLYNMKLVVGYPDELLDESKLSEFYQSLQIESMDYFGNKRRLETFSKNLEFSKLREPVDPLDWREMNFVADVNARYIRKMNLVTIFAGILQGLLFNKDRPNYLNYGSIGHIFAHEITHGFDDIGQQYDSIGNLGNWWDNKTDESYKEKVECFINQYNNYTMKEINQQLNGTKTKGENIADNGGILLSYKAYLNYVEQYGPEPTLPALNYTSDQLFWISSAVKGCSKATDDYLKYQVLNKAHSPSKPRLNCMVSNSKEFSEAFNCPPDSPMNPVNKCIIW